MSDACCGAENTTRDDTGGWSDRWETTTASVSAGTWLLGVAAGVTDASSVAAVGFVIAVITGGQRSFRVPSLGCCVGASVWDCW